MLNLQRRNAFLPTLRRPNLRSPQSVGLVSWLSPLNHLSGRDASWREPLTGNLITPVDITVAPDPLFGPVWNLNGTSSYIRLDTLAKLFVGKIMTVSFWFKTPSNAGGPELISTHTSAGGNKILMLISLSTSARLELSPTGTGDPYGEIKLNDDVWHNLVVEYDDRSGVNFVTCWIDTVQEVATDLTATYAFAATDRISLGQEWDTNTPSNFFSGQMADFRLYEGKLSEGTRDAIFNPATRFDLYDTFEPMVFPLSTGNQQFEQALSGAISPAAALSRSTLTLKAGSLSPVGAALKHTSTSAGGAIGPAGAAAKNTSKTFTGAVSSTGAALKTTLKNISGATTPAGLLNSVKSLLMALAGAITPAGAVARHTATTKAGAITPAGAALKQTSKTFTGLIIPAASLSFLRAFVRSLSGAITPAGATLKSTLKAFDGSLSPAGLLDTIKVALLSLSGSISPSGAFAKIANKNLTGSATPSGSILKRTLKAVAGVLSVVGDLTAGGLRSLFLTGSITPAASRPVMRVSKSFAAALSPSGLLARGLTMFRFLSGVLVPHGAVTKRTTKTVTGAVSIEGGIVKRTLKSFAAALSPVGQTTKTIGLVLVGVVALSGGLVALFIEQSVAGVKRMFRGVFKGMNRGS